MFYLNQEKDLKDFVDKRKTGITVGLCHGCFDLLHAGHIEHLNAAKSNCDFLIVSITADKFIDKGPNRPVFNEDDRRTILSNLKSVDAVYIANEKNATNTINLLRPDFYFKGIDYADLKIDKKNMISIEADLVEKFGGK